MLGTVRQQFERLRSKSEILHTNVDPTRDSALLDLFVKIIARTLDAERCSIFIHDPVKEKVWLKSGTGVGEREIEVPLIEIALDATAGNQAKCADLLGINRNTLRKKITELDIRVTRRRKLM